MAKARGARKANAAKAMSSAGSEAEQEETTEFTEVTQASVEPEAPVEEPSLATAAPEPEVADSAAVAAAPEEEKEPDAPKKLVSPKVARRLQAELKNLASLTEADGFFAKPRSDDNILNWTGFVDGPKDTPYEGGRFKLRIQFPEDYPFQPMKMQFDTQIYHVNINANGGICLDRLKAANWSPTFQVQSILQSVRSLLNEPNPEDPLVSEIAALYKADKAAHDRMARQWTKEYAMDR